MRVVAGEVRSIPLIAPEGKDTRPTTDRIKETLFNIIQDEVPGSNFLDLFSGSGAIGIEALSRGAKRATFVELAKEPLRCIHANIEKCKMVDKSIVLPIEATYAVSKLSRQGVVFDIIFMDPPYRKGFEEKLLEVLAASKIMKTDTLVILETALETNVDYVNEDIFEISKVKDYKTNRHVFLRVR